MTLVLTWFVNKKVSWPSGLGDSLQNYLHRFDSCIDLMKKKQIDQMVKAIRKVTKKACKNKKSARKFLIKAGIIKK